MPNSLPILTYSSGDMGFIYKHKFHISGTISRNWPRIAGKFKMIYFLFIMYSKLGKDALSKLEHFIL